MTAWDKMVGLAVVILGGPFFLVGFLVGSIAGAAKLGFSLTWKAWSEL